MERFFVPAIFGLIGLLAAVAIFCFTMAIITASDHGLTQHDFRAACRFHNGVRAYDDGHLICLDGATPDIPFND